MAVSWPVSILTIILQPVGRCVPRIRNRYFMVCSMGLLEKLIQIENSLSRYDKCGFRLNVNIFPVFPESVFTIPESAYIFAGIRTKPDP